MRKRSLFITAATLAILTLTAPLDAQMIRGRIRDRIQKKQQEQASQRPTGDGQVTPRPSGSCQAPTLGFRIVTFSGSLRGGLWYPTTAAESKVVYAHGYATAAAHDAPVADCGQFPVLVFSHGFGGCSTNVVPFLEAAAKEGYVVAAPDHQDSDCKVDQAREGGRMGGSRPQAPFQKPKQWTDKTHQDRRDDIRAVLDALPRMPELRGKLDLNRIAGAGHSLGGYTIMGLAGGWSSWRDSRIKAALLFSPFSTPYLEQRRLQGLAIPVMYQGGDRDFGITPPIKKQGGIYDQSPSPKYFVEFSGMGHLGWTVASCRGTASVEDCLRNQSNVSLVNQYGLGFLNRYVRGTSSDLASPRSSSGVKDYRASER